MIFIVMKKIFCFVICILAVINGFCASAYDAATYQNHIDEIDSLLKMCEAKNLNVNYERSAYITLSEFKEYMEKDIASGAPEDQIKYNDAYLESLYTDTKQALEGYLDGSMIPRASGQKTNSFGRNVKGKKLVDSDGNPIFSVGFGHFARVVTDCETLVDWGMDNIAVEICPIWTTRKTDICNFQLTPYTTATISADTNGYEGSCLKIVNAESGESSFSQLVQVEPNTSYTVTAYAKCDEPYSRFWMGNSTDWKIINNTWQKFTWDITTGTDEWFYALKFGISAKTTGFYIDNIIMEVNGENKVLNGDFKKGKGYYFHNTYKHIFDALQAAQDNNAACNVLFQPAYMPTWWGEVYPETTDLSRDEYYNNFGVIINHNTMIEFYKEFYAFTAHMLKKYDSLSSIILANEPRYETLCAPDFYNPKFAKWLKEEYSADINKLNSAYDTEYTDFNQVKMPERFYQENKTYTPLDYDWLCFNQDMVTEFFTAVSGAVRSEADVPVSIKAENPLVLQSYQIGLQRNLRYGINVEKLSPAFDIAGCDNYCVYNWKETRSDTMAWYDMLVSLTGKPVYNSEEHIIPDNSYYYGPEQARYVRYNLWQGAVHGKVMSSLWTYSRPSDTLDTVLGRPDCMYEAAKTAWQLRDNTDILYKMLDKAPKIALLYSQSSRIYSPREYSQSLYSAYQYAVSTGAKAGFVTDEDISKLERYQVLILPNTSYITSEALNGIRSFIQNGGTAIRLGECFKGDEHKQNLDSDAVSYIVQNSIQSNDLIAELNNAVPSKVQLTDTNGNPVAGLDMQYSVKAGRVYVNICNITNNPINFNLSYNGEAITSAISELENSEITSFIAEPTVPMLLSFDSNEDIVSFEILSFKDGTAEVKSNCTNYCNATVAVVLKDKSGNIKGIAANTKRYRPGEIKKITTVFSDKSDEDTLYVKVWKSLKDRTELDTVHSY